MGQTKKPCDGCGQAPAWRRETGKVCSDCQHLLELGRKAQEELKAQANGKTGTSRAYIVPEPGRSHDWPWFDAGRATGDWNKEPRRLFQDAFSDLVYALGTEISNAETPADTRDYDYRTGRYKGKENPRLATRLVEKIKGYDDRGSGSYHSNHILLEEKHAAALRQLYLAVAQIADDCKEDGKDQGHSLLVGLATGRLSVHEFNERTNAGDTKGEKH